MAQRKGGDGQGRRKKLAARKDSHEGTPSRDEFAGRMMEAIRRAGETRPIRYDPDGFTLVSQKGDLGLVHWRRDVDALRAAEVTFARTRLRGFLVPTYSYLAVIELGTYELMGHAAGLVKRRGLEPGQPEFDAAVKAEMEKMAQPRLYPAVPSRKYLCFYPMSKRRGEQVNWYDLPAAERAAFMRGHGEIGRKYAGQVVQVIQGSVGLDDWEWGVTLFADDPVVFKKLIYEMRFDAASSRFALFGPFYIGIRCAPADLGAALGEGG